MSTMLKHPAEHAISPMLVHMPRTDGRTDALTQMCSRTSESRFALRAQGGTTNVIQST